ncbi:MAG TPA: lipid A export permease/ATP-binding protein MsbA [Nitrospiria bacterium]|jgi:subfamily B ATP-binding cassette protein MsbA
MKIYLRLLRYLKPYWPRLVVAIILASFVSSLTGILAWLVEPVLDKIFAQKDTQMLFMLTSAIFLVTFLKGLFSYGQAYFMRYVGNRVLMDLRNEIFGHTLSLPLGFFTKYSTGRLMSRVINDVTLIQSAVSGVVKDIFQHTLTVFVLLGVMIYQDWKLTLLALFGFPLSSYLLVRFGKRLRRLSHLGQENISDLTNLLQESLSGIRVVKAFTMDDYERKRFKEKNLSYFRNLMRVTKIQELTSPLMEVIGSLGLALMVGYGGYYVIQGNITQGTFFSFMAASMMMYAPVRTLASANNMIQQAIAASQRVFSVLDEDTEQSFSTGTHIFGSVRGAVEYKGVSFHYEGSDLATLKDVWVRAQPGEIVALVGSSGSGKTTLVNLLPRFFEPTAGEIIIDNIKIQDATLTSLRQQIGIVSQETVLFDDTVVNNISYGEQGVKEEAVIQAAQAAFAHPFISRLPQGYETMIGERGVKLSGGERQRLAIARALLRNAPILILDEATSALDSESELMVQQALVNLMKNRTTFVIAHRLSTIKNATQILVLDHGQIVERGSHDELLQRGGVYKRLYQVQFREEENYAENL